MEKASITPIPKEMLDQFKAEGPRIYWDLSTHGLLLFARADLERMINDKVAWEKLNTNYNIVAVPKR